jgi:hypothetical protein
MLNTRNTLALNNPQFLMVEDSWNVMAHVQKPDFVFCRDGQVHLNRRGRQFSRLPAAEARASAEVMLDTPCSEIVWRVLATHSIRQFPPSLPLWCITVCHHISTGVYTLTKLHGSIVQQTVFLVLTTGESHYIWRYTLKCGQNSTSPLLMISLFLVDFCYSCCNAFHMWIKTVNIS